VISLTSYAVVCSNVVVHNSDHNCYLDLWTDSIDHNEYIKFIQVGLLLNDTRAVALNLESLNK